MTSKFRKDALPQDGLPEIPGSEKRSEPRRPAQGAVRILRADQAPAQINGRLIDISARGFRAAHACTTLTSGEIVEFSHEAGEGIARVVWTRVNHAGVSLSAESGFLVVFISD